MRWQPETPVCDECGFDWRCSSEVGIATVRTGPDEVSGAMLAIADPTVTDGERWSASMYIWHLVDVLRIGTERLLTLALDPGAGVPCWDENALAADRRYADLSPVVGLRVLATAAAEWVETASTTPPDAQTSHPELGMVGTQEIITRNAHEVHHHLLDIRRWGEPGKPPSGEERG